MENPQTFVGIDVSSQRLDVDTVPVSQPFSEPNNEDGISSLTAHLKALNPQIVLLEATGGYEQAVVRVLHAAGIAVSVLEAGRVRHFARAQGQRAKTDPIDAAVLADYGRAFKPPATLPASPQQHRRGDRQQLRPGAVLLLRRDLRGCRCAGRRAPSGGCRARSSSRSWRAMAIP